MDSILSIDNLKKFIRFIIYYGKINNNEKRRFLIEIINEKYNNTSHTTIVTNNLSNIKTKLVKRLINKSSSKQLKDCLDDDVSLLNTSLTINSDNLCLLLLYFFNKCELKLSDIKNTTIKEDFNNYMINVPIQSPSIQSPSRQSSPIQSSSTQQKSYQELYIILRDNKHYRKGFIIYIYEKYNVTRFMNFISIYIHNDNDYDNLECLFRIFKDNNIPNKDEIECFEFILSLSIDMLDEDEKIFYQTDFEEINSLISLLKERSDYKIKKKFYLLKSMLFSYLSKLIKDYHAKYSYDFYANDENKEHLDMLLDKFREYLIVVDEKIAQRRGGNKLRIKKVIRKY